MGRGSAQRATADMATGADGAGRTTPHTPTMAEVVAQLVSQNDAMVQMRCMLEEFRGRLEVGDADRVRLQQQVVQGEQLRHQDVGRMQELSKKQRRSEDVVKPLLRRSVRVQQQKTRDHSRRESFLAVSIPATGAMAAAGAREGAQASAPEAPDSGAIAASTIRKNKRLRRLDNSAPSPRDAMSKK